MPPALTVALWRLRQTWRLLLAAELGVVAAVMLLCTVPLFSRVATSAGLRSAVASAQTQQRGFGKLAFGGGPFSSDSSDITVVVTSGQPSLAQRDQAAAIIEPLMRHYLGTYLTGTPSLMMVPQPGQLAEAQTSTGAEGVVSPGDMIQLLGDDVAHLANRVTLAQGRLPSAQSAPLEVAITQTAATELGIGPGATLRIRTPGASDSMLTLQVVGVFTPPPAVVLGAGVSESSVFAGDGSTAGGPNGGGRRFYMLASNEALLAALGAASSSTSSSPSNFGPNGPPDTLQWTYHFDFNRITIDNVDALTDQMNPLENDLRGQLSGVPGVLDAFANLQPLYILRDYSIRVAILQIPTIFLLLQVLGLVLLFVRLMADILVERQAEAIAILRSRGAARRHIFGALTLHGLGLSLIALIAGPLLAIPLVMTLGSHILAPADRGAVTILAGNPLAIAWNVRWYALAAAVVSAIALIFSINRAARFNVLALRRESARSGAKPLWQRLHLDLGAAVIGLALYIAYILIVNRVSDINVLMLLSPLSLFFPIFLLVGVAMLFLRIFPLVLRALAWLAARRPGASAMVALAQMARSPRQALRMTLLFALSTAFAIFVVVYTSSASQRAVDVATFLTGADFSGSLHSPATGASPTSLAAPFASLPGVRAATVGYTTQATDQTNGANIQVVAVDPATYANATIWTRDDTSQPIADQMRQLAAQETTAPGDDSIAAILDAPMAQLYHVGVGDRLEVPTTDAPGSPQLHLRVVAIVQSIPQIASTTRYGESGGVLVDYAAYTAAIAKLPSDAPPTPNQIWLRTSDDPTALAGLRAALATGTTQLDQLLDRRALITAQQSDPLQVDFFGVLGLGAATALLLALVGILLASWLSARARVTNFAVLRALGTTPRQLVRVLVWEQAIVYVAALVLGVALGSLLAQAVLPALVFSNLVSTSSFNGRAQALLDVPPVHAIFPTGLIAALVGGLIAACVVALIVMAVVVSRVSLGQSLRLNED
jgi:ABC-type lipoprotein release transport system permease subunit